MNTLLLTSAWGLTVNSAGNIATAYDSAPVAPTLRPLYALAQDVASAVRLFQGELWYDTTQGLPYFQQILNHRPPAEFLKAQFVQAALTVPGVASAVVVFSAFSSRLLVGAINGTAQTGGTFTVNLNAAANSSPPWYVNAAAVVS
jgi:hypothetical protein